jgi:hypothetical protein
VINVREVRFTPVNGHHPGALACRFCATTGLNAAFPERSNKMTPYIPEEFSTPLIDRSVFVIMGNTMPPRDRDEDEEDDDEEEEDRDDEEPVVREPDED